MALGRAVVIVELGVRADPYNHLACSIAVLVGEGALQRSPIHPSRRATGQLHPDAVENPHHLECPHPQDAPAEGQGQAQVFAELIPTAGP